MSMPSLFPRTQSHLSLIAILGFSILTWITGDEVSGKAQSIDSKGTQRDLAENYGFSPLIASKVNDDLFGLCSGDFNGDGRLDMAAVDNRRAQISFFFQKSDSKETTSGDPSNTDPSQGDVNDLKDEVSFRRHALATDQAVDCLVSGDINGDSISDIVFSGESNFISVALSNAQGRPAVRHRIRVDDRAVSRRSLALADMNGDSVEDIVMATRRNILIFPQNDSGEFDDAVKIPNSQGNSYDLLVADLDRDGHSDLLTVQANSGWPFRIRYGREGLAFSPVAASRFAPIRGFAVGDADGDGSIDIAAVRRQSGRISVLRQGSLQSETSFFGPIQTVTISPQEGNVSRGFTVADIDGDGDDDAVFSEGSAARLIVFRGSPEGLSSTPEILPSLVGVFNPKTTDLDGDGSLELIIASKEERAIGVSTIVEGAISLPMTTPLPPGELIAFDVSDGDLNCGARVWITMSQGSRRSRAYQIGYFEAPSSTLQNGRRDPLGEFVEVCKLEDLPVAPDSIRLYDLDRRDGLDILLSIPTELPRIGLSDSEGKFRFIDVDRVPGLGLLKDRRLSSLHFGDVNGDSLEEVLVPGANFARAWTLESGDGSLPRPEVVLQCGLDDPTSQVDAVAAADLDGDGEPEIYLSESEKKRLTVFRGKTREVLGTLDLVDLNPHSLVRADVHGDGKEELLLIGEEGIGIVATGAGESNKSFYSAFDFESTVKDAFLDLVALGDINGDGRPDLILSELRHRLLQIFTFDEGDWLPALKFQIFEEKFFERGEIQSREPREIMIADVTGDDRNDLILLIHDRILVYPQDS